MPEKTTTTLDKGATSKMIVSGALESWKGQLLIFEKWCQTEGSWKKRRKKGKTSIIRGMPYESEARRAYSFQSKEIHHQDSTRCISLMAQMWEWNMVVNSILVVISV